MPQWLVKLDERAQTVTFPSMARTDDLEPSRSFVFRRYEVQMTQPLPDI